MTEDTLLEKALEIAGSCGHEAPISLFAATAMLLAAAAFSRGKKRR